MGTKHDHVHFDGTYHYVVVGGGAAGFFGAITCARQRPAARVTILEAGPNVLGKVKISGGGRCNVTHACFEPRELSKFYPRGQKALLGPFHQFCTGDTMGWFEDEGVPLKIEDDGRVFPVSDSSQSIMDALLGSANAAGVEVLTRQRVVQVYPPEETGQRWKLLTKDGTSYFADAILVAPGSSKPMWEVLHHLGHRIIPPVPSLFTFNCKDPRIEGLPGVSVPKASVTLEGLPFQDSGPLLITHWGFSGPAILKLSAWAARELHDKKYAFTIRINWLGGVHEEEVRTLLKDYTQFHAKKTMEKVRPYELPKRLWLRWLDCLNIPADQRWAQLSKQQRNLLVEEMTRGQYTIQGKSTFKDEFVTAGGVDLDEVDFKRFESRIHRNLFMAGEILNIDAVTGGFNFQAAWTGGWLAGHAMASIELNP
jgi:predicted Rossmann fold flavoprotein